MIGTRTAAPDARERYLRRVVDSIPPITPEQRERITALLASHGEDPGPPPPRREGRAA